MSGKGSAPRPFTDRNFFESEFDRIFRKQKEPANETLPTEAIPSGQNQPEVGNGDGGTP